MTKGPKKTDLKNEDHFVIKYTKNEDLAKDIQRLLESQNIPVILQDEEENTDFDGFALLVPEENFEEARMLIESEICISDCAEFIQEDPFDQNIDF